MVISRNSQLGLMFFDTQMMQEYLTDIRAFLQKEVGIIDKKIDDAKAGEYDLKFVKQNEGDDIFKDISSRLTYIPENQGSEFYTVRHPNPHLYLLQPSVETCAAAIRVNDGFSCTIFNKIKDGEHVYLLGKNEFYRFIKFNGVIRANYWNRENRVAFELGFHLDKDRYYFPHSEVEQFNRLVRLMIFVALGDIEVEIIEKGKNNGKPKKAGKITNTSEFTVYVVDSSWNKLIIRTEGFAVMGHFRLQACGEGFKDRKLIWIDAFEKHGYTRTPKAKIIN